MTKSQIEVIKSFENNEAVLVEGLAGTGKSIIALEQAKKLTENENDTVIFCFNRLLKNTLSIVYPVLVRILTL